MTYSSTLSMSRGHYAGRNQNVVSFASAERKFGPISNTIILVVLACLLGMLYLTQVTKTNAYGYEINSLQQKQASLVTEHNDLILASARFQSLDRIAKSPTASNLVAVGPSDTLSN
jgi:hypothetical protein